VYSLLQVNRQVVILEERKKKLEAECNLIGPARAEIQKEVDVLRKGLQSVVSQLID